MELVLTRAPAMYLHLMKGHLARRWDDVFESLSSIPSDESCDPLCYFDWTDKPWAAVAGRDVKHIPSKFTAGVRGQSLIDGFGTWFQSPKAAGKHVVNFHDATDFLRENSTKASLDQVPKSRETHCYMKIPLERKSHATAVRTAASMSAQQPRPATWSQRALAKR